MKVYILLMEPLNITVVDQTDKTKKFIKQVKNLKETGLVKTYAEVVEALDWDKASISNVINGRENITPQRYSEFCRIYGIAIDNPDQIAVEQAIRSDAKLDVILAMQAEILAHLRGQTGEKIKLDLVTMVNQRLKERLEQL